MKAVDTEIYFISCNLMPIGLYEVSVSQTCGRGTVKMYRIYHRRGHL